MRNVSVSDSVEEEGIWSLAELGPRLPGNHLASKRHATALSPTPAVISAKAETETLAAYEYFNNTPRANGQSVTSGYSQKRGSLVHPTATSCVRRTSRELEVGNSHIPLEKR